MDDFLVKTDIFLSRLVYLNKGEPIFIYLWSCHGNLAQQYVNILPENSILITHTSSDNITITTLTLYAIKEQIQKLEAHNCLNKIGTILLGLEIDTLFIDFIISFTGKNNTLKSFEATLGSVNSMAEVNPKILGIQGHFITYVYDNFGMKFELLPNLPSLESELYVWSIIAHNIIN